MRQRMCILILFLLGIGLGSCRTTQYVPVETVRTNTEYRDLVKRDSIHVHDSVFLYMKGDTVFRDRWHTEYKNRLVHDTTYISKIDSIQVPYPVEKKLSGWESAKMELGGVMLGFIILSVLVFAWWMTYSVRKK